jgi:hypothetical protein
MMAQATAQMGAESIDTACGLRTYALFTAD